MGRLRNLARKLLKREKSKPQYTSPQYTPPKEIVPEEPEIDLSNIECTAQEMLERIDTGEELVIIDVREAPELRSSGIITGAIHIPLRELSTRWEEVKDANEVICYCAMGVRSYNAAMLLRGNGVFNATSMDGGMSEWKRVFGPITPWTDDAS